MLTDEDYQRLGLTELQAAVILSLMELGGESTAPDIIEHLGSKRKVNRTSIYSVLNKLEQLDLVIVKDTGRGSSYALVTRSPEILMNKLLEPQKPLIQDFRKKLERAKEAQEEKLQYELYYLENQEQILSQLYSIIEGAENYLLIMATSTILEKIENRIKDKAEQTSCRVLIIPTWNPDPNISMDQLFQRYQAFLDPDHLATTLPVFNRIVPKMQLILKEYPIDQLALTTETYFVQALSEDEMLMGTYVGDQDLIGSGIYSREPMISQILHIIFMNTFEGLSELSTDVLDEIISIKTKQVLDKIGTFVNH